jgi:hypothetical protein
LDNLLTYLLNSYSLIPKSLSENANLEKNPSPNNHSLLLLVLIYIYSPPIFSSLFLCTKQNLIFS